MNGQTWNVTIEMSEVPDEMLAADHLHTVDQG